MLWQAVLHFDAERGVAFSTYAVVAIQRRMWQAIAQAQRTAAPLVLPRAGQCVDGVAEENLWQSQVEAALLEAVRRLPTRPRQVIVAVYGLDGQPPRSLAEWGERGVSAAKRCATGTTRPCCCCACRPSPGACDKCWEQDSRAAYARSQALSRAWQRQRRRRRR